MPAAPTSDVRSCIAVLFTSELLPDAAANGYAALAGRLAELAARQPGFLGRESVRGDDGVGITVSYWRDEASIATWRNHPEHIAAKRLASRFYRWYRLRTSRVIGERAFGAE